MIPFTYIKHLFTRKHQSIDKRRARQCSAYVNVLRDIYRYGSLVLVTNFHVQYSEKKQYYVVKKNNFLQRKICIIAYLTSIVKFIADAFVGLKFLAKNLHDIVAYFNFANFVALQYYCYCKVAHNWISIKPVRNYLEQLQLNPIMKEGMVKDRPLLRIGIVGIIFIYMMAAINYTFHDLGTTFGDFEGLMKGSYEVVESTYPFMLQYNSLVIWLTQLFVIFTQFHYLFLMHFTDMSLVVISVGEYYAVKEFIRYMNSKLIDHNSPNQAEGEGCDLTGDQLLKLYANFKDLHRARNKYAAAQNIGLVLIILTYESVHSVELLSGTKNVNIIWKLQQYMYALELYMACKFSADINCMVDKCFHKLLRKGMIMKVPDFNAKLILHDFRQNEFGTKCGRFFCISPEYCGELAKVLATFSMLNLQNYHY